MDYLICTSPRSGSNLLSNLLIQTQQAGTPREYLCTHQIAAQGPKTSGLRSIEGHPSRFQRYYDGVRRANSQGGRFGMKAHFHQLVWANQNGFRLQPNRPDRFVHLTRADVLGQAISFVRAQQTGAWHTGQDEKREPWFDADAITKAITFLQEQDQGWQQLFAATGIEPYRMAYETFVADMPGELTALLEFLDIDTRAMDVEACIEQSTSRVRRQRDGISGEWRARYRELVRVRAAAAARLDDVTSSPAARASASML